jgi:hypothetical protein
MYIPLNYKLFDRMDITCDLQENAVPVNRENENKLMHMGFVVFYKSPRYTTCTS